MTKAKINNDETGKQGHKDIILSLCKLQRQIGGCETKDINIAIRLRSFIER